jgi:hypothetical protein
MPCLHHLVGSGTKHGSSERLFGCRLMRALCAAAAVPKESESSISYFQGR